MNNNVFAMIVSVGEYSEMEMNNLPTYKMDAALLGTALENGLLVPYDNIRISAGTDNNGYVTTQDLAKGIAGFKSLLGSEDTFVLYFSGHGRDRNIIFSNGQVELQSVIDFIDSLKAKNKLVILDCCYSGKFVSPDTKQITIDDCIEDFVGRGIAVFASADEPSRLGPQNSHSMFTGALSTAILQHKSERYGCYSLQDMYEDTMHLVKAWNKTYPDKAQQPIFRNSIRGTIYFKTSKYTKYNKMALSFETEKYNLFGVEPLSTGTVKRLSAFITVDETVQVSELPAITNDVADRIKYAEIYSSAMSEERFEGTPARVIWCYFGHDESDVINRRFFAYTIWAADDEMKDTFFRSNKDALISDGIYIFQNKSYDLLKEIQKTTITKEEYVIGYRKLLSTVINSAEDFITDLQEIFNGAKKIEEINEKYKRWFNEVRTEYLALSDYDMPPDELNEWSQRILNLAGCVLDMAIYFERRDQKNVPDVEAIKMAIKQYYQSIEKIKTIEEDLF